MTSSLRPPSAHSPLPWIAAEVIPDRGDDEWGIRKVGETFGASIAQMVWRDDAEFIVRACNSHEELLAALKWAMRHLRSHVSFGSDGDAYVRLGGAELAGFVPKWEQAEAAIAKATDHA